MKFAFALFTYFPYGGLTRDLIAIARVCRQRGHQVKVYAATCRAAAGHPSAAEMGVQLLPVKARANHIKDRQFAERLQAAVAQFSPHVLVGFNKMPGLDVYYAADGCFAEKSRRRSWWYRLTPRCRQHCAFEQAVFGREHSTQILVLARRQLSLYQNFYHTPTPRMTLLPPGISRDRIAGDDASTSMHRKIFRAQWRLADDERLLLAVGSGFRTKGLERTLKALAAMPAQLLNKSRLFVIGDDKAAPFEKIARRFGVHAKVLFFGGRNDVPEFLVGADLLLHPAHRENSGTVLLEAMVAGLPVIATDVCGYAHYIRDENMGEVLASPFSQAAFNHAISKLLAVERSIWRKRGHAFAQQADIYNLPQHACKRLEVIAAQRLQTNHSVASQ